MALLQLIDWSTAAQARAERLRALGYDVTCSVPDAPDYFRRIGQQQPAAVLIALDKRPSQGREVAIYLRRQPSTRRIPLLFVGGAADKLPAIGALLPDAAHATWEEIGPALEQALAHPPADPVTPSSVFAAYAGRPLAAKLGRKAGVTLTLVDAPPGMRALLGGLPAGAVVREGPLEPGQLTVWFVRTRAELAAAIAHSAAQLGTGKLWIAWPKRASGVATDLAQQAVREAGLAAGLVDYKIAALDETWSGLLFTRRKG